jgi:hypothetical protein
MHGCVPDKQPEVHCKGWDCGIASYSTYDARQQLENGWLPYHAYVRNPHPKQSGLHSRLVSIKKADG